MSDVSSFPCASNRLRKGGVRLTQPVEHRLVLRRQVIGLT
jgi:hypothetical protein